jgi:hypothetical protein
MEVVLYLPMLTTGKKHTLSRHLPATDEVADITGFLLPASAFSHEGKTSFYRMLRSEGG